MPGGMRGWRNGAGSLPGGVPVEVEVVVEVGEQGA